MKPKEFKSKCKQIYKQNKGKVWVIAISAAAIGTGGALIYKNRDAVSDACVNGINKLFGRKQSIKSPELIGNSVECMKTADKAASDAGKLLNDASVTIEDNEFDIIDENVLNAFNNSTRKRNFRGSIPVGCQACGGPYPSCKLSCPIFDD